MTVPAIDQQKAADPPTTTTGDKGYVSRPEVVGSFGVVASTCPISSTIGLHILECGGNAFDAATAVGFALQLFEPEYNGAGGELVALVRPAGSRSVRVLCGQGTAPSGATREQFKALGYDCPPAVGLLAATVPGAYDALLLMLKDLGTMSLAAVLAPVLQVGRAGIPAGELLRKKIQRIEQRFQLSGWEASKACYFPDGGAVSATASFRNEALLATLESIVAASERSRSRTEQIDAARRFFYCGPVARAIVAFSRRRPASASAEESGGLFDQRDFETWRAHWETPVSTQYGGWTVYKAGPWTQGPTLLQHLNLLKAIDPRPERPTEGSYVHLFLETAKIAFADRDTYYGDPDFVQVPLERLLSMEYARRRAGEITDVAVTEHAGLRQDIKAFAAESAGRLMSPVGHEGDTCHFDVIDRFGNVVSATPSGGWFQDSPMVPDVGIALTTRAQMFNLIEGHPNCIAPRKRPRTTLSPTIAIDEGERVLSIGTPGADHQEQYILLAFLRCVQFGCSLKEAVEGVAYRSDHLIASVAPHRTKPGGVTVEERFPQADRDFLVARGHVIEVRPAHIMSMCTAAMLDGGVMRAAAGRSAGRGFAIGR